MNGVADEISGMSVGESHFEDTLVLQFFHRNQKHVLEGGFIFDSLECDVPGTAFVLTPTALGIYDDDVARGLDLKQQPVERRYLADLIWTPKVELDFTVATLLEIQRKTLYYVTVILVVLGINQEYTWLLSWLPIDT